MKIAINTRLLLKNRLEGIGWFTYETLQRITTQHPEHEFFFIFDRAFSDEFIFADNITPIVAFPQARHPVLYYIYFEYSIPQILKKTNADLFLSTDGYIPLSGKTLFRSECGNIYTLITCATCTKHTLVFLAQTVSTLFYKLLPLLILI